MAMSKSIYYQEGKRLDGGRRYIVGQELGPVFAPPIEYNLGIGDPVIVAFGDGIDAPVAGSQRLYHIAEMTDKHIRLVRYARTSTDEWEVTVTLTTDGQIPRTIEYDKIQTIGATGKARGRNLQFSWNPTQKSISKYSQPQW